jgi:hypothetical protein
MRHERAASWQMTAKPISIKSAECKFGGCAQKAIRLTLGDLLIVAKATEDEATDPDRSAEVSRGHSTTEVGRPERFSQEVKGERVSVATHGCQAAEKPDRAGL